MSIRTDRTPLSSVPGRSRALALAAALTMAAPLVLSLVACGDVKVGAASLDAVTSDPTACQEQHPEGVVAFVVAPDGAVRAGATGADGQPAKIEGGTLAFRKEGGQPTEAKLAPEGDGKVATAKGPPLDGDVTAVDYAVQVAGKTLKGVIHLPAGGTKTLAETSTAAAPEAAPGPNGGQVQTLAGEPVEVAVAPSGDVVAYVLGADRKPAVVTGRTLWVLVDGEKVALTQRADGAFIGRTTITAPRKITLVQVRDGKRYVVVVGHKPGLKIVANRAPGVVVVKEIARTEVVVNTADQGGVQPASAPDDGGGKDKDKDKAKDKDKDKGNNGLGNDKPGTPGYKGDKDVGKSGDKGGGNDKGGGKGGDKKNR